MDHGSGKSLFSRKIIGLPFLYDEERERDADEERDVAVVAKRSHKRIASVGAVIKGSFAKTS